jgi:hypothetical protein
MNIIEKENCANCNGRGEVGHPDDPNGRCSACRGLGTQLTKRGRVVSAKWFEMTNIPARKIKSGSRIVINNEEFDIYQCDINGVVQITTSTGQVLQFMKDELVKISPTGRQREDMLIELIKFRESLLKSGTPRKKR